MVVVPVLHRAEPMDISVKRIEIARQGEDLICRKLRADIQVAFFVRVNNTERDIPAGSAVAERALRTARPVSCLMRNFPRR
jgi:uncharacterized membrane protein YqiK